MPYETLPEQPGQGIVSILGTTTVEGELSQELSQLSQENSVTIESSFQTTGSSKTDAGDFSMVR